MKVVDRVARKLAEPAMNENGGSVQTRRRFVHNFGRIAGGIAGLSLFRDAPLAGAESEESHIEHLGAGPDSPVYWPEDGGVSTQWLPAPSRSYRACAPGDEACGYCTSAAYYCAGRYPASNGNYYCYEWIIQDRHCGADNISCDYDHYCSRSTSWGSRCRGPAGCV